MSKQEKNANKEFKIASWAIDNPSVIFVMIALFLWVGFSEYQSIDQVELRTIAGELLYREELSNDFIQFSQSPGSYIITIILDSGQRIFKRVIIY